MKNIWRIYEEYNIILSPFFLGKKQDSGEPSLSLLRNSEILQAISVNLLLSAD